MKTGLIAAFAAFTLAASAAQAAPVVYTITGSASGHLDGQAFSDAGFTFTLTGDTDQVVAAGTLQTLDPLISAQGVIDGFDGFTILTPTALYNDTLTGQVAFDTYLPGLRNILLWKTTTPQDLTTAFGPVGSNPLVQVIANVIPTTGGDLAFDIALYDGTAPVTFSSETRGSGGAPGGVPEPATWALMLVGFGGLGSALRRRRAAAFAGA
ncbi:PEPxxWA-CTERM sorting domain-containing protein [Phenylobacterium sp.]|uniref:PEPxxWA-CTERM sorting domain-containing protein n=1 Tax=Phenylobacterium sp. TaxID=1871053 RepID=UPI0025E7E671|nr:PEPxxWA-CTERM sorting domain-containing protein [Phenylobacterium sp.]